MALLRPFLSLAEAEAPRETGAEFLSVSAKMLRPARSGGFTADPKERLGVLKSGNLPHSRHSASFHLVDFKKEI